MSEQLTTFYSHRTEDLVAKLLWRLAHEPQFFINQPFGQCTILVPNSGMQRYLELQIARTFGICSHIRLMYPGKFLWQQYQQVLPQMTAPDSLDTRQLTFQLLALWQTETDFLPPLSDLLNQYQQPRQRYQLAANLAVLFKQYLNERPDMIAAWQGAGAAAEASHRHWAWQRDLFNRLNLSAFSRENLVQAFHQALPTASEKLPEQVHVFGFHALPPAQLTDLLALATQTAVTFYTFNPSVAYWQDIVPESIKYRSALTAANEAALLTVGNPLLAAWGQGGKYLIERLNEYDCTQLAANETTAETAGETADEATTILQQVQHSITHLTAADVQTWQACFANEMKCLPSEQQGETDFDLPSISLHIAAGARREVEILYDNLLNLLAANSTLKPSDILVMVSDLPAYAPHIQAVFGTAYRQGQLLVPFSLANQTAAQADSDTQAFLSLLRVVSGDFQAQTLFECLNEQPLRQRFGLQPTHLLTIRQWLSDSHFSGDFYDNSGGRFSSLEKLLDNLLLAYAAGEDGQLGGRVAAPFYQAQQQETLAMFTEIIQVFRGFARLASQSQTLSRWFAALQRLAMQCLPTPNGSNAVTEQLAAWFDSVAETVSKDLFDFETVIADIEAMLQSEELRGPFLSGGVSFCAVQPMRAIPAKMICLLGVGQEFPAVEIKNPLDLRRVQPRWSDRRAAKENRYFFLETLMAAREKLYLSYSGVDEKTAQRRPPSVLVSELLDFISRQTEAGQTSIQALQFEYPLQGFMAAAEQSYQSIYQAADFAAKELAAKELAATELAATELAAKELAAKEFAATELAAKTWSAKALATAIENPLAFYVQTVLQGQSLTDLSDSLRTQAVVSLDSGLDKWEYRTAVLSTSRLAANDFAATGEHYLQQRNLYAPDAISRPLIENISEEMQALTAAVQAEQAAFSRPLTAAVTLHRQGQDYRFLCSGEMTENGLLTYAAGALTAKRLLTAWINHVLLNTLAATSNDIAAYQSTLLTQDKGGLTRTQFAAFSTHAAAEQALTDIMDFIHTILASPYPFSYQKKSANSNDFLYKSEDYPLYERLLAAYPPCTDAAINALFEPIAEAMNGLRETQGE